jgi:hypothetical protein
MHWCSARGKRNAPGGGIRSKDFVWGIVRNGSELRGATLSSKKEGPPYPFVWGPITRPTPRNTLRPNYGPSRRKSATFYGQVCYRSSAVIGVWGPFNKVITEGKKRQFLLSNYGPITAVIRFCDIYVCYHISTGSKQSRQNRITAPLRFVLKITIFYVCYRISTGSKPIRSKYGSKRKRS